MSKVKNMPLMRWLLITMVAFVTFGTLFIYKDEVGLHAGAASKDYESIALPMQIPTAFFDYRAQSSLGVENEEAQDEINRILNEHYGNVGMFVGPRDESSFSSAIGALHTPNSISLAPDEINALGLSGSSRGNIMAYYEFGRAVHNLSERGKGMTPSATNATQSLDKVSNTATGISRAGMKILIDYSPGPLIEQLYTGNRAVAKADNRFVEKDGTVMVPGIKLVNMIEGTMIGDLWETLSIKPLGNDVSVTITTLILATIVILLVIGSIVSTIFGGRAGESLKKVLTRIVIASVALPLMGMIFHWGLSGAAVLTDYDMSQEERDAEVYIGKHLNLAGWATTGFMVPQGMTLNIVDGKFSLTHSDIKVLNTLSYYTKYLSTGNRDSLTKEFLEGVANSDGEYMSASDIFKDMQNAGRDDMNKTAPSFGVRIDGDSKEVAKSAAKIGSAIEIPDDEEDGDEEGEDEDIPSVVSEESNKLSYIKGSNFSNKMEGDGENYKVIGVGGHYGISPISVYNMFLSDFTGNAITMKKNARPYTSVVYHASNGQSGTTSDGKPVRSGMNGLIKFIAVITVSLASLKGLGQIFMGGFGGLIAGTARSSVGSAAGFGQAVGGVIALVGGVIGMSFIINISFELLDALYDIINYLFRDASGEGASIMAPIGDTIREAAPWFLSWVGDALESIGNFIVSIIAFLALPRFGSIPIDMFSAKMAELPGNMSDRAQQMENRFTGDFRSGGGGGSGSGVGSAVNSALKGATGQANGLRQAGAAGAGMALGLGGMGLSKIMNRNNKEGDKKEGDKSDSLMNTEEENFVEGEEKEETALSEVDNSHEAEKDIESHEAVEGGDFEQSHEEKALQEHEVNQENENKDEVISEEKAETIEGGVEQSTEKDTNSLNEKSTDQLQENSTDTLNEHNAEGEGKDGVGADGVGTDGVGTDGVGTDGVVKNSGAEDSMGGKSGADKADTGQVGESTTGQAGESMTGNAGSGKDGVGGTTPTGTDGATPRGKDGAGGTTSGKDGKSGDSMKGGAMTPSEVAKQTSPDGGSVSGEAGGGLTTNKQTVNAGDQTVNTGQPKEGKSGDQKINQENKTNNHNSNKMDANTSIGGDTEISKGDNTKGGNELNKDQGKGGSVGGNNTETPSRGRRMAGAMKRIASKENRHKLGNAAAEGMKAAGGEVSVKRVNAAIMHASASSFGLQDKFKTGENLDRASGKAPRENNAKNNQTNKQQQTKQKRNNEQMHQQIQSQEREQREQDEQRRKNRTKKN